MLYYLHLQLDISAYSCLYNLVNVPLFSSFKLTLPNHILAQYFELRSFLYIKLFISLIYMFETKVAIDQNIQIFNFKGPFSDTIYSMYPLMMNKHFKTKKIFYDRIFSRGGLSCFQLSIPCIEYPEIPCLKKMDHEQSYRIKHDKS